MMIGLDEGNAFLAGEKDGAKVSLPPEVAFCLGTQNDPITHRFLANYLIPAMIDASYMFSRL